MIAVMTQPVLAPTAPSSRHDIISALLNDYGTSFRDDGSNSPYALSPVPALKELPPPPTPSKNDKPLPPVLSMQFQLRVNEASSPASYSGSSDQSPTKIESRSMSRSSKPPSLRLTVSNGSTATLPPPPASVTPAPPAKDRPLPDRPLPGLPAVPPPPPAKSELRADMGNKLSKTTKDREEKQPLPPLTDVPKRRPLPRSGDGRKQYPTLADLSRGRKGGTRPVDAPVSEPKSPAHVSAPSTTTPSVSQEQTNSDSTELSEHTTATKQASSQGRTSTPETNVTIETPPTPEDLKSPILPSPSPVPEETPSKYGLQAREPSLESDELHQPLPSKHYRGKSSTGFDIFKASSGFQNARAYLNTITPSPTPSPLVTPSALSSGLPANPRGNRTNGKSETSTAQDESQNQQAASANPKRLSMADTLNSSRPVVCTAPAIRPVHTDCYHQHARFHRSSNRFAPTPCMLCYKDDKEDRWTCIWCCLRICTDCRAGLEKIPQRNLLRFKELKGLKPIVNSIGPEVVIWET